MMQVESYFQQMMANIEKTFPEKETVYRSQYIGEMSAMREQTNQMEWQMIARSSTSIERSGNSVANNTPIVTK